MTDLFEQHMRAHAEQAQQARRMVWLAWALLTLTVVNGGLAIAQLLVITRSVTNAG